MKNTASVIIAILLAALACKPAPRKMTATLPVPVRVTEVAREEVSIPVHSGGVLLSNEEVKLSFKTGGLVSRILAREGDKVKKGQKIAVLNLSEINAQVNLAGSAFEKAGRDLERVKRLYADSVATLEQLQNATTAVSVARSNLDIAKFNLNHSIITAPDDGIILRQLVRENELVSQGYPVFLFGCKGKNWRVKTGLADRDVVRINPGDSAVVSFDAWPGVAFPGTVDIVSEMASQGTGTYDVELAIEDKGYRFAAGFIASVDIYPSGRQSYLLVPVGAIIDADGSAGYLFSVNDSDRVSRIKVNIIALSGDRAAINAGQNKLKRIVSEGAAYLRDGEKVKIMN